MFDRLDDMLRHYEELMLELNNPSVAEDQRRFRKLMKEQADLAPIVDAYKQYKQAKQDAGVISRMFKLQSASLAEEYAPALVRAFEMERAHKNGHGIDGAAYDAPKRTSIRRN